MARFVDFSQVLFLCFFLRNFSQDRSNKVTFGVMNFEGSDFLKNQGDSLGMCSEAGSRSHF